MGKDHVCVTNESLLQMEGDLKDPLMKEAIEEKVQEIQGCAFCKRLWLKYWANKSSKV